MSPADRALAIVAGTYGSLAVLCAVCLVLLVWVDKKIDRLRREQQQGPARKP